MQCSVHTPIDCVCYRDISVDSWTEDLALLVFSQTGISIAMRIL